MNNLTLGYYVRLGFSAMVIIAVGAILMTWCLDRRDQRTLEKFHDALREAKARK